MLDIAIDILVHLSMILGIGMFVVVARKTQRSQVRLAFLILLGVTTLWNLGTLLELDVRLATGKTGILFIDICYIAICLMPVAILYLGIVILKPDWRLKKASAAFLIVPLVSIVLVFTDPLHGLFFKQFSLYSSDAVYGTYYYFHALYSYGCIAAGIIIMYIASTRNSGFFSIQSLLVIAGIIVTLVPNMLYSFGVGHLPFSISAAASTFSILCFSIAFLKFRFIEAPTVTLRQIVDLISDAYLVLDKKLCVLSHNLALTRMFPDKTGATLGKDFRFFVENCFADAAYDSIVELYTQAMKQHITTTMEVQTHEGACIRMEITPVAQQTAQIASIILLKDVTESKQLIEATKAASRAKGDFLSQMSHEIRTPLNAIIGMINIGIGANDAERMKYCFKRADSASKHLLGIINDVLDMSKIEAEKFELSYCDFEFNNMLMNIRNIANVRVSEKHQNFTVNVGEDVPTWIEGDELRLSQAITNLLTNAVKFTPENGSIALIVDKTDEQGDDVTLRFEVADSGIGLSPDQQEKLFTSYSQADASISKNYGGTGLGLFITKQIVELMGGSIWIESELGCGSKFIFTIKAKKVSEQEAQSLKAQKMPENSHYDFHEHTLLAVEDIEINREIMSAILYETSANIDFAENGRLAVSMFSENPGKYSLILMDIQMPEMNGYEATKAIRAMNSEYAKKIPIIAMTASVFKEDIERCIASGMNDHTGKPVDTAALLGVLNKYLTNPEISSRMKSAYELKNGVAWDDGLLTGNALVDMQHQRIFAWVSELVLSCEAGTDTERLWDTLEFLDNHTIRHFIDEEALMLECGYPDRESHFQAHKTYRESIEYFQQRFNENGPSDELSNDVNKNVATWLIQHIQTEDRKIAEYIRSEKPC